MSKYFFLKKPYVNLRKKNKNDSEIVSQIIYGEKFKIIKKINNWFKIRNSYDGYVGYIKKELISDNFKPTHKVITLKSTIFKKNKNFKYIKTNKSLPFASKIMILNSNKKFSKFQKNQWLKNKDIVKENYIEKNLPKILKLFLNTKYKWGGKIFNGIDCSGLLQVFFQFNNIFIPRDTKDQIKFFKVNEIKNNFQKNTLIFWKGHIAICINKQSLIHAYGPKKKVIIMNIKKTINEIKNNSKLIVTGIKKINAFRKKR